MEGVIGRHMKEFAFENGFRLEIIDESVNYYADFWNLKLVVRGRAEISQECLEDIVPTNSFEQMAKEALGDTVEYYREITQIGVRERELKENVARLLGDFENNALPYLMKSSFPKMMVKKRWAELAEEIRRKHREKRKSK